MNVILIGMHFILGESVKLMRDLNIVSMNRFLLEFQHCYHYFNWKGRVIERGIETHRENNLPSTSWLRNGCTSWGRARLKSGAKSILQALTTPPQCRLQMLSLFLSHLTHEFILKHSISILLSLSPM